MVHSAEEELYREVKAASSNMAERLALLAARSHGTTPAEVIEEVRALLWADYRETEPHRAGAAGDHREERRRRGAVVPGDPAWGDR